MRKYATKSVTTHTHTVLSNHYLRMRLRFIVERRLHKHCAQCKPEETTIINSSIDQLRNYPATWLVSVTQYRHCVSWPSEPISALRNDFEASLNGFDNAVVSD